MSDWPVEDIPDKDLLYFRVHETYQVPGTTEIRPGAFRDRGAGMSSDWEKYSTPEQTRARAQQPDRNGVVSFHAGSIRIIKGQTVVHEPISPGGDQPPNRAHTEVFGKKDEEVRLELRRIAQWTTARWPS
jgi:hypothetical protein